MSELNQKLVHFTATILAEATAETECALAALTETRTAAHSAAEDQILAEVYRYIHREVARVKTEAGRQVSRHMLDDKRALYLRRGQIADEVFALVREKLSAYTQSDAYPKRMTALYLEALDTLGNAEDVRIFLRPADRALSPVLAAARPRVKAQFLDGTFALGGLIADAVSSGRRADATFDSAIDDLSGHFAELFGLSLSDELTEE